jgi:transcriptional regulator with XRE-family HTH domain
MTKGPIRRSPGADASRAVWSGVSRQLSRRRIEEGFSVDGIARCIGLSPELWEEYEAGAPIPASVLAQIAELLDTPVVWFFQDVVQEEDVPEEFAGRGDAVEPAVYTVATVEHRAQALVDCFRKLDLEGQQHLLAISMALSRASAGAVAD